MSGESTAFDDVRVGIPGVRALRATRPQDDRGWLLKFLHAPTLERLGIEGDYSEVFATWSRAKVIRGLHFQAPPADHAKLVACLEGHVLDALVDVRKGSPTFGRHATLHLEAKRGVVLYVPTGVAHGFAVLGRSALMLYATTSPHSPEHDGGIRWDSAGIAWPSLHPIISRRDAALPELTSFESPFAYNASSYRPCGVADSTASTGRLTAL